ncbi:MAG TPA: hypothetical protein PKA93_13455, partial [Arachnia sp.]|nr:hypothetical protein [Arachnia sp.]
MLTARYAALQSSYWGAFCLVINFVSVFLLAHGLTNAQIGVLMAVASAVATVVQPIVAGRVDRSRIPLRLWLVMGGIVVEGSDGVGVVGVVGTGTNGEAPCAGGLYGAVASPVAQVC